jgi:hypothetical protein
MITSTLLAVLFVPVFQVVCEELNERRRGRTAAAPVATPALERGADAEER